VCYPLIHCSVSIYYKLHYNQLAVCLQPPGPVTRAVIFSQGRGLVYSAGASVRRHS